MIVALPVFLGFILWIDWFSGMIYDALIKRIDGFIIFVARTGLLTEQAGVCLI